jgi:hypothetical protein
MVAEKGRPAREGKVGIVDVFAPANCHSRSTIQPRGSSKVGVPKIVGKQRGCPGLLTEKQFVVDRQQGASNVGVPECSLAASIAAVAFRRSWRPRPPSPRKVGVPEDALRAA